MGIDGWAGVALPGPDDQREEVGEQNEGAFLFDRHAATAEGGSRFNADRKTITGVKGSGVHGRCLVDEC